MRKLLWIMTVLCIWLNGCSSSEGTEAASQEAVSSEENTSESAKSESIKSESIKPESIKPESVKPESVKPESSASKSDPSDARQLDKEELAEFQTYFNDRENNGFLQTSYDSPAYMDLGQVLYNGAGIAAASPSESELQAYLQKLGRTEVYTDVLCLTTSQIDALLQEKAGIGFQDVKTQFQWDYVPELDSYFNEHGDTNYMEVVCVDGTAEGDYIKVHCTSENYGTGSYDFMVSLKKKGQGYQFVSNSRTGGEDWMNQMSPTNSSGAAADTQSLKSVKNLVLSYRAEQGKSGDGLTDSIFNSDIRFYRKEELAVINPKLYPVFRNEIYARHGYIFKSQEWNDFFSEYSWYQGRYDSEQFQMDIFNEFEVENLKRVLELER